MKKLNGFTLIEIAIVLLIVSILLGYTVAMAPRQIELKQFKEAKQEMGSIIDSLYAYGQVNGHLPCPAWYKVGVPASAGPPPIAAVPKQTSNGFECRDVNGTIDGDCESSAVPDLNARCDVLIGFVPAKTLGIIGDYSPDGLLLDPWGAAYIYQVTGIDFDVDDKEDFVVKGEMTVAPKVLIADLAPDLNVCNAATTGSNIACDSASETVIDNAPAIILSTGKNKESSTFQDENTDAGTVYISRAFSDDFDDIVRWVSPNILYSKMIEAGQLP